MKFLFWQWSGGTDKSHNSPSGGSRCQSRYKNQFSGNKGNEHTYQIRILIKHENILQCMQKTITEKEL